MKNNKLMSLDKIREIPKNISSKFSLKVYIEDKEKNAPMKNKYTLNEIGTAVFNLVNGLSKLRQEVDELRNEVHVLRNEVGVLRNEVGVLRSEVNELKQEVKSINNRLDYIVKANKLKDLPRKK